MKTSRPFVKEVLVALAFFAALGGGSLLTYQLMRPQQPHSFSFGGYDLRAESRRPDGTYIGVTLSNPNRVRQIGIFAKLARRDANKPSRWILSDGFSCAYNSNGALVGKTTFQKMVFDTP